MTVSSKAGRYELQQELGRGSMGVVYRALDPVIGRTVAVKTVRLTAEVAGLPHNELLERFQTEARAAGLLAHPNIVVVYDAGEDDGLFYITMELVEGRSLQEQMNLRHSLPLPRVLRWMQQACAALEFAHQHSVIHRDIKPANLMLTADDTLKVTDFGTAKILQLNTTQTAHVIGTPSYMSPEQIKGKPVDGRTDVFSLGVVLYELLTSAKPFPGESVTAVIYKVVNEDPIPPRELDAAIHPGLSAIVQRALAKSPYARFQTCGDFAEALQHYQDFEVPRAARTTPTAATTQQTPTPPKNPAPSAPILGQTPWATLEEPKNNNHSALIALLLLVVIGAAGYRVYPAMQEIWHRSHPTESAQIAPASTVAPDGATPDASAPATADTANTSAIAPAAAPAAPPAAASVPVAPPPADKVPSQTSAPAQTPASVQSSAQSLTATSAPADGANAAVVAPTATQRGQTQTIAKPSAVRKSSAPQPSQIAAEWKDLIEAKLASSNIEGDVHVAAAGNSVTLTGKLDPAAHSKLLGQLQYVPAGLQIIDDIEYADPTPSQSPQ